MGLFSRSTTTDESGDAQEGAQAETKKAVIEGEYDPTKPKRINGKEWWIERINEHNELETYAGEWCRAMIENAVYEPRQPMWLGCSERTGREFGIEFTNLFEHVAYLGSTGSGKTTAVHNSVLQLVMGGHGVGIVDPKGDDLIEFLRRIPKRRWDDVVYVDIKGSWELEDPESGEMIPHHIGFNILETYHDADEPGYDAEVEWIVDNFMQIAGIRPSWSLARRVLKTIVRWMTRHEEEFTIIEVFYAILSEENRAEFSHLLGEHVDDDDILFIESYLAEITDNMSTEQLNPLIGKLKDWIEEPMTRRVVAQRGSGITLSEVVNGRKILVVNNDLSKELRKKMANVIKTGVWSAVTGRMDPTEHRLMQVAEMDVDDNVYEPFFLSIDECHAVFQDEDNIEGMLMEARSKQLGLLLSTQTLRSLPDNAAHAIVSNCRTVLSMDPGDPDEARLIADKFGDVDPAELQRTPEYHALTQLNNEDDPFLAKMIPPYPPRHSIEDVHELIQLSLRNYGAPAQTGREIVEDIHFDVGIDFELDGDLEAEEDRTDEEEKRRVIKSVYDASIRQSDEDREQYDGYVPIEETIDWVVEQWDVSQARAAHTCEVLISIGYFERQRHPDVGVTLQPSPDGLEFLGLDSGINQTGGGAGHRTWLLPQAYQTLTRAGYDVRIPEQGEGDGELPDGLAEPVMDLSSSSLSEAEEKRAKLGEDYPAVAELSDGGTLVIEAESSGTSKPAGPLKNLHKADDPVLFVVAEEGADGTSKARRLVNIIQDPVSAKTPPDADARLYTGGDYSTTASGTDKQEGAADLKSGEWFIAAPKGIEKTEWVRFDEKIVLRDRQTSTVLAEFEDAAAFERASPDDFPVRYRYDVDRELFMVYEDDIDETRKYSSKKALRSQECCVKIPTVPELAFSEEPVHGEDWAVAVVPNDGGELRRYDPADGSLTPLLNGETETKSPTPPSSRGQHDLPADGQARADPHVTDISSENTGESDRGQSPSDPIDEYDPDAGAAAPLSGDEPPEPDAEDGTASATTSGSSPEGVVSEEESDESADEEWPPTFDDL